MSFDVPVAVAIATVPYTPVKELLCNAGWRAVLPFYEFTREPNAEHPLGNGWELGAVDDDEVQRIYDTCSGWADETSLYHYEAFIAWHADLTEVSLTDYPILAAERYATKPLLGFLAERHGQLVDVGSHLGEAVLRLTTAGVTFSEYILIEPDSVSRRKLEEVVRQGALPASSEIRIINNVVGMQPGIVNFIEGLGYCSQIWEYGSSKQSVIPLDEMDLTPDLIKIHTEGSEFAVLAGARKTINKKKPALTFSIYHNRLGLTFGVADLMAQYRDYSWYFRMHSFQGTGAFVYGVPAT